MSTTTEQSPLTSMFSSLEGRTYHTVCLDPPWPFADSLPGPKRGAEKHYEVMTEDDILAMPIPELLEPDAHVYLWVTNSHLALGLECLRRWGLTYKLPLTWLKVTNDYSKIRIGMGHYYRNSTEHALFATRGKLPALVHDLDNVIIAPRNQHSEKPEEFYDKVRSLSPGPRLDIFSRRKLEGFDIWGNEAPV